MLKKLEKNTFKISKIQSSEIQKFQVYPNFRTLNFVNLNSDS